MAVLRTDHAVLYAFKIENGRAWYLLLRRGPALPGAGRWEPMIAGTRADEGSGRAAVRALVEETRLSPLALWAIDQVELRYESESDAVLLMPCFAVMVSGEAHPGGRHDQVRWLSASEAANLITSAAGRASLQAIDAEITAPLSRGADPDARLRIV